VRIGLYQLSGTALVWSGYAGAVLTAAAFVRPAVKAGPRHLPPLRSQQSLVIVLALAASAAVPWYAYLQGHPFRIRYDVPLIAACGVLAGAGIGLLWRPMRPVAAVFVVSLALVQAHPLDRTAPLIKESQRDAANKPDAQPLPHIWFSTGTAERS
jgi:hypothetical protein